MKYIRFPLLLYILSVIYYIVLSDMLNALLAPETYANQPVCRENIVQILSMLQA